MLTIKVNQYEVCLGKEDTLEFTILIGGSAVTFSASTYTLYDSSESELDSGSITPSGNVLSVTIGADTFDQVEENCRLEIEFTVDGTDYKENLIFDVVKYKLHNSVSDSDLEKWYPEIDDQIWTGETNYNDQIEKAFEQVRNKIKAKGRRPDLIVDNSQIKTLIELKSLEIIFRGMIRDPEDNWAYHSKLAKEDFIEQFSQTVFKYDSTEDGTPDNTQSFGRTRLNR